MSGALPGTFLCAWFILPYAIHMSGSYAVLPAVDIRCHASGHPYLIIKANFTNPISAWLLRWLAASLRWQRSTSRPRRHPRRCICAWLL